MISTLPCILALSGCGAGGPPWSIRGSARLPDCSEPPSADLDGTLWFDQGTVTLTSAGCEDAPGTVYDVCGLGWAFQQTGNEVEILVDHEYLIAGRLCGDDLHLEGGFWLTVQDQRGGCDYEDGVEVGIEATSATLRLASDEITGTLAIRERCTADYAVTLHSGG